MLKESKCKTLTKLNKPRFDDNRRNKNNSKNPRIINPIITLHVRTQINEKLSICKNKHRSFLNLCANTSS